MYLTFTKNKQREKNKIKIYLSVRISHYSISHFSSGYSKEKKITFTGNHRNQMMLILTLILMRLREREVIVKNATSHKTHPMKGGDYWDNEIVVKARL